MEKIATPGTGQKCESASCSVPCPFIESQAVCDPCRPEKDLDRYIWCVKTTEQRGPCGHDLFKRHDHPVVRAVGKAHMRRCIGFFTLDADDAEEKCGTQAFGKKVVVNPPAVITTVA